MPATADAIVVLGCRLTVDGRPSERLRRRVARAVELYHAGAAPLLVLSGGGSGPIAEADAMRDLALAAGVPEAALLSERASRNTVENAFHTARLLRERGMTRVILVSDRSHLPRAALLFRRAGLDVVGRTGILVSSSARAVAAAVYELGAVLRSLIRLWTTRR
ncbi:MAG TPA: YdcF family protein [Stellaceae bacterium]|nr:YdcF family protein [Stellaceae bacterium]